MFRIKISFEDQEAEFHCKASDTIMEAARRQGILLASYCEQGGCGACTAVLEKGSVAYIRSVKGITQQPAPGEVIRPCSAMPLDDLELAPISRWKTFPK